MRRFIFTLLLIPLLAWGGLLTTSGRSSGPSGGSGTYDWIDNPVGYTDHWVDPAKTTNGAAGCPEVDPCQWSQMMAFDPAGGRHRFIVLPGQLTVTTVAADSKMPVLDPQFSGTAANPVLVKAQYPATRSTTTTEQRTVIRRTAEEGSILGTAGGADYWKFDGIFFAGGVRSDNTCANPPFCGGNENAVIVLRSTVGWSFTRFHIDSESVDWTEQSSTNGGGVFMQGVDDILLQDFIIENVGDPALSTDIWQGVEMYDATDVEVAYFRMQDIWGLCVHMKGSPNVEFVRNRIHHGLVDNCNESGISPYDVQAGADPANHNYWWNIVVLNSFHGVEFNRIQPHQGTHLQNLTVVGSDEGIMINMAGGDAGYVGDISIRNSVVYNNTIALMWLNGNYDPDITFNYNRYNTYTTFTNSSAGNWTFGTWQTNSGEDANSDQTAPTFTNAAGGDYTTASSVSADRPDTHNLYGGGSVRVGAWEAVGPRTNL